MKCLFFTEDITDATEKAEKILDLETQLRKAYVQYQGTAGFVPMASTQSIHPLYKKRRIEVIPDEIKAYLHETAIAHHTDQPLSWWRANGSRFPILSKLAKDYLGVPGSSASSERAFSKAGLLITDRRTRLSSASVTAGCLLQSWYTQKMI